jgi:pyrimidine oxygenase
MQLGVFLPIANNGWLISHTAPHYLPTFELNCAISQAAESYGFDFVMSMVRFKGYGGETRHWDYSLESFTLMAAIAAVTKRIKLIASTAILTIPPTVLARMAVTIDSVAPGRFGVNIVSGWSDAEYQSMGIWPGQDHFSNRYQRAAEYVTILRQLWTTGRSTFKGSFYETQDAHCLPLPTDISLIAAGMSDVGLAFVAEPEHADYNFAMAATDDPLGYDSSMSRLRAAAARTGRSVGTYGATLIIAAATDAEAEARWTTYKDGVDYTAHAGLANIINSNAKVSSNSSTPLLANPAKAVSMGSDPVVGSFKTIARRLDEAAESGVTGIMLTFDDFLQGIHDFGKYIQPLMKTRRHINSAPAT